VSPDAKTSAAGRGDPFGRVLGAGRGLTGTSASQAELKAAEDKLAEALSKLSDAASQVEELLDTASGLRAELQRTSEQLNHCRRNAQDAEVREVEALIERDRARYAAMCANGQRDPCGHVQADQMHQREWSPGRPYLSFQHARHPKTHECYTTDMGGAPAGEMPGAGRHWQRCIDLDLCPLPEPMGGQFEHRLDGPALRQTHLWWDREHNAIPLRQLTDDHLNKVIAYLRTNAQELNSGEWRRSRVMVPAPYHAYETGAAWMADTPLMRALLRERNRRRQSARRQAARRRGDHS
jgi:hypothetical protein